MEDNQHEVEEIRNSNVVGSTLIIMIGMIILITSICLLNSCTLSFQNVMTSGTASDVVDSDPKTDAQIDPTLTIPASVL